MVLLIILIILIAFFIAGILSSKKMVVRTHDLTFDNLPQAFDGYRIVQLTDLHGRYFGEDQGELIELVRDQKPDIIALTGDVLDAHDQSIEAGTKLCKGLLEIAPVLWVKGNHFHKMKDADVAASLHEELVTMGVTVLDDTFIEVTKNDAKLYITGLDDPQKDYPADHMKREEAITLIQSMVEGQLEAVEKKLPQEGFRILLNHRPGNATLAKELGYDVMFAGHTHGGQLCLPGGIEVIGVHGEFFPELNSGINDIDGMPLVISSGLGYSNIDLRLYNPPEIVVADLHANEKELG